MDPVNNRDAEWPNLLPAQSREKARRIIISNEHVKTELQQGCEILTKIRDQVVALHPELALSFEECLLNFRNVTQQVSAKESEIGSLSLSIMQNAQPNNAATNPLQLNGSAGQVFRAPVSSQAKSLPNPAALVANGQPNLTTSTSPPLPAAPKSQPSTVPQAASQTANQARSASHNAAQGPIVQALSTGPVTTNTASTTSTATLSASAAKAAPNDAVPYKFISNLDASGKVVNALLFWQDKEYFFPSPSSSTVFNFSTNYKQYNLANSHVKTAAELGVIFDENHHLKILQVKYKDNTAAYFAPASINSLNAPSQTTALTTGAVTILTPPAVKAAPNPLALAINSRPNLSMPANLPLAVTVKSQPSTIATSQAANQASSSRNATQGPVVQSTTPASTARSDRIAIASGLKVRSMEDLSALKLDAIRDSSGKCAKITITIRGKKVDYLPVAFVRQFPQNSLECDLSLLCNSSISEMGLNQILASFSNLEINFLETIDKDNKRVYYEPASASPVNVVAQAPSISGNSRSSSSSSSAVSKTTSTEKQASKLSKKRADREQNDSEKADSSKRNKKEIIVIN